MLHYWLSLYYTPQIGPARFKQLINFFGSVENAYHASNADWRDAKIAPQAIKARQSPIESKVESALNWLNDNPLHTILTYDDPRYPHLLKKINNAPPLLFVKGNCDALNDPQIAIVGTRHPTDEGKYNSYQFAKELSHLGFTITSGLAMGVDGEAHRGVVENKGKTIAVLGTGLERIYPKRNTRLSIKIIENNGALVSEFPLHTPPRAENFPRRNRIIAGLSLGTLVVEAALKSGSLITARLSLEFNREVFSIPSSIHNPQAKGTHSLIQQGAKLTESTLDIIEEFQGWFETRSPSPRSESQDLLLSNIHQTDQVQTEIYLKERTQLPSDPEHHDLFHSLDEPRTVDDLVNQHHISSAEVSNILLLLELEDLIKNIGANRYLQKHRHAPK